MWQINYNIENHQHTPVNCQFILISFPIQSFDIISLNLYILTLNRQCIHENHTYISNTHSTFVVILIGEIIHHDRLHDIMFVEQTPICNSVF